MIGVQCAFISLNARENNKQLTVFKVIYSSAKYITYIRARIAVKIANL